MLKYELIPEQLLYEGVITPDNLLFPEIIKEEFILLTHGEKYWQNLRDLKLSPAEERRIGFKLSERLVEREMRIAQGTIETSISALKSGIGFNVAGGTHHAGSDWGEGFCLLNDQAIAANHLIHHHLAQRVLIIDLDVHQGNGTAEIFQNQSGVFTFSMHAGNNFPFRKEQSDLDVPLEDGMGDEAYLFKLKQLLPVLFDQQQPDFVFYLAGVDILTTDKLGKLSLSKEGCMERDNIVLQACKDRNIPLQISMGGGYSPQIKDIVDAHCNTFKLALDIFE